MPMENSQSQTGHRLKTPEIPLRAVPVWEPSSQPPPPRAIWPFIGQYGICRLLVCWTLSVFPCRWLFDPVFHHADRGGDAAALPGAGSGAAHAPGEHWRLENNKPLPLRGWYVLCFYLVYFSVSTWGAWVILCGELSPSEKEAGRRWGSIMLCKAAAQAHGAREAFSLSLARHWGQTLLVHGHLSPTGLGQAAKMVA